MSAETVRAMMNRYLASEHEDLSMMADDVVFTNMATGDEHTGRERVRQLLQHIYHVAFDARAETRNVICEDNRAVLEAVFVGRHIGEFAGVPASKKEVRVPLCVVYDVADGKIRRGRVYFEIPVFLAQVAPAAVMAPQDA